MARSITWRASIVVLGFAVASTRGHAQATGTSTRIAGQKTISRARLDEVLGRSSTSIRVVRKTGVSDLQTDAGSVGIAPETSCSKDGGYGETDPQSGD